MTTPVANWFDNAAYSRWPHGQGFGRLLAAYTSMFRIVLDPIGCGLGVLFSNDAVGPISLVVLSTETM